MGENPWDGPHSLIDMLEIPDAFKPLISDYKFNLIELRKSEYLKFHNDDVWRFCLTRAIIPVLSEPVFRLTLIHFDFA